MSKEHAAALARLPTTVVAYDLETSGLSDFDQVLQVAALRTDRTFALPQNPERQFEMRARRQPWIVPSPAAMLVTRTSPEMLADGATHHFVIEEMETFFIARTPSLYLGYNSMRFDEQMLRQCLFRSLLRPYLTQSYRSTRADLMIMAQAIAAIDPSAIDVPLSDSGAPTFRLGPMCRANGIDFSEAAAHDALADVRATLRLAQKLLSNAPDLFDRTLALADKRYAQGILRSGQSVFRLKTIAGAPSVRGFGVLDATKDDANGRICVDLTVDPGDYLNLDLDGLRIWTSSQPSPLAVLRTNAQPMVFSTSDPSLAPRLRELVAAGGVAPPDADLLQERAARISADEGFIDRIHTLLAGRRAVSKPLPHPDQQLYSGGFAEDCDYQYASRLRKLFPWERAPLTRFYRDPRLKAFAERIACEEDERNLAPDTRARMRVWHRERLLGPRDAPWRTIAAARAELDELWKTVAAADHERLNAIRDWLDALEADAPSLNS